MAKYVKMAVKSTGISFMVRIRNEEKTLEQSIRSLFTLTIPYEIILILHCCTDKSKDIALKLASENKNIKIVTYDIQVSRAGYENLATHSKSKHSFVEYSNFCLSQTSLAWVFRWDADFIATPSLIQFLNSKTWEEGNSTYIINAINSTSKNGEGYLTSALMYYKKHVFWEVALYKMNSTKYVLDESIFIKHNSELADLKEYWKETPWYLTEKSDEATQVQKSIDQLTIDYGKEPEGLARGSNPECTMFYKKIVDTSPSYVNF